MLLHTMRSFAKNELQVYCIFVYLSILMTYRNKLQKVNDKKT